MYIILYEKSILKYKISKIKEEKVTSHLSVELFQPTAACFPQVQLPQIKRSARGQDKTRKRKIRRKNK